MHRLIKNKDRSLEVVFSRFMCFSFTITMRLKPKGVTLSTEREPVLRRLHATHLGILLIVIVNEKHIHLIKTTSRVLSVILINL